jgi:probable nitrogen fixation protein
MSTSTIPFSETDFTNEIVKQIRAVDTYGEMDKLPPEKILAPFILTKEQRREVPIVGDPDEEIMGRVKAYYNAIASLVEKITGLMPIPMINLHHEGFGRVMITVGKLVAFEKTLRDIHRFSFLSLEKMQEEAGKIVTQALELIEKYREVAEL